MATSIGREKVNAYIDAIPAKMNKVLRGAARAAGKVIAEEIKANTPSDAVREDLRIQTRAGDDQLKVVIDVKPGWGRSVGIWLEWGTDGHFITVDDSQRAGRSVGRINQQVREEGGDRSLVIGGAFVGTTVWHPGTRPQPTFRPALDMKGEEAKAAAQNYINAHVSRAGIKAPSGEGDEA